MATKRYLQHNKQCFACGREMNTSHLGYDVNTMKTYCMKKCRHPEDIPNVTLVPATNEDLTSAIVQNFSEETEKLFMSMLGTTASTRLRPAHIMHILKVAEMEGTGSTQQTIINIIEADMEARNMDHIHLDEDMGTIPEPVEPTKEQLEESKKQYEAAFEYQERQKKLWKGAAPVEEEKEVEAEDDGFEI